MYEKKNNTIPYYEVSTLLEERIAYLQSIKGYLEKELAKAPAGNISVFKGKSDAYFRYYNREQPTDKYGKYIDKTNTKLRTELAQKKYHELMLRNVKEELRKLQKIESYNLVDSVIHTYENIHPGIKKLIVPIEIDDEQYAIKWQQMPYDGNKFTEQDVTEFYSKKGERMRSKSEVLIANALYYKGIPYKYECPIYLPNGKVKYPDFTILHIKQRKTYYWEHFGKMDDVEYVENNVKKISEYEKIGIILGDNLIITMETSGIPLGTRTIENLLQKFTQ